MYHHSHKPASKSYPTITTRKDSAMTRERIIHFCESIYQTFYSTTITDPAERDAVKRAISTLYGSLFIKPFSHDNAAQNPSYNLPQATIERGPVPVHPDNCTLIEIDAHLQDIRDILIDLRNSIPAENPPAADRGMAHNPIPASPPEPTPADPSSAITQLYEQFNTLEPHSYATRRRQANAPEKETTITEGGLHINKEGKPFP
jgi:hypothetical protein